MDPKDPYNKKREEDPKKGSDAGRGKSDLLKVEISKGKGNPPPSVVKKGMGDPGKEPPGKHHDEKSGDPLKKEEKESDVNPADGKKMSKSRIQDPADLHKLLPPFQEAVVEDPFVESSGGGERGEEGTIFLGGERRGEDVRIRDREFPIAEGSHLYPEFFPHLSFGGGESCLKASWSPCGSKIQLKAVERVVTAQGILDLGDLGEGIKTPGRRGGSRHKSKMYKKADPQADPDPCKGDTVKPEPDSQKEKKGDRGEDRVRIYEKKRGGSKGKGGKVGEVPL
jgi:hypothetical protein